MPVIGQMNLSSGTAPTPYLATPSTMTASGHQSICISPICGSGGSYSCTRKRMSAAVIRPIATSRATRKYGLIATVRFRAHLGLRRPPALGLLSHGCCRRPWSNTGTSLVPADVAEPRSSFGGHLRGSAFGVSSLLRRAKHIKPLSSSLLADCETLLRLRRRVRHRVSRSPHYGQYRGGPPPSALDSDPAQNLT